MPLIGAYWLRPSFIARASVSRKFCGGSKSGKPCPRFTALCSSASWLMTVKIVVPTLGNFVSICMRDSSCEKRSDVSTRSVRIRDGGVFEYLHQEVHQRTHGGQHAAPAGIHDVQDALRQAPLRQHLPQPATAQLLHACAFRQPRDAAAGERGFDQHAEFAAHQPWLHLHALRRTIAVEQFPSLV